jgi:hypothetical protein
VIPVVYYAYGIAAVGIVYLATPAGQDGIQDFGSAVADGFDDFGDGLNELFARNESGQRNYLNDQAAALAQANGTDQCTELQKMMDAAKQCGDTNKQKEVKQAQKAARCRRRGGD